MEWIKSMKIREGRLLFISVAFISASVLMLEIGMIRVFSVMFESHYAFLLISMAVLGLGFGGVFVHKWSQKTIGSYQLERLLPISSALMGSSILIMTVLIIQFSLFRHILLSATLVLIPFCFAGIFLSTVFRLHPKISGSLYAADLIGAATGALLTIVLLQAGGVRLNLMISILAGIPAILLLARSAPNKFNKPVLGLVVAGSIAAIVLGSYRTFLEPIPFADGAFKEMTHLLNHPGADSELVDSRWSSFGRTDLVYNKDNPDEMGLFVDGTAGTAMYRFNGNPDSLQIPRFSDFSGYFPFKLMPDQEKEKILIIGAGGGREVLTAILGGAKDITAIEANRDLVDIMKKHSDFNGGIYNNYPGVRVIAEEGRKFVRSTDEKFDVIMLSIPVTKTSRSLEGYALTENFLFTKDSINDYLDRLAENGRLIVVAHNDLEILRLVLTNLAAMQQQGVPVDAAMNRLYVTGPKMFPVFVLKKEPLTLKEAETIHSAIHESGYGTSSSFVPYIEQEKHSLLTTAGVVEHHMLNPALYALSTGEVSPEKLIDLFSASGFDVKAVSDDTPFFYKFEAGLPAALRILLIFSSVAMLLCWITKSGTRGTSAESGNPFYFLLLFSLLGIGFMMIEIPLFQTFILFLGQPAYSAAILLFSLLIGAGIGSWTCDMKSGWSPSLRFDVAAIATGILAIAGALFLKQILGYFLWMPFAFRVMVSFVLLMPLGFFMGMLFPTGMILLRKANLSSIIPKMWAVNGIGSVLGATLSISISISYGFSYAILQGGAIYLFIVAMTVAIRSRILHNRGGNSFAMKKVPEFASVPVRSPGLENRRECVNPEQS